MGDVAHELPTGVVVGLDVLRHPVEGVGQIGHLAFALHALDPDGEIAPAEPLGRIGDLLKRVGEPPHQEGGHHAGAEQHDAGREEEVRPELFLEGRQPCAGGAEEQIPAAHALRIPRLPDGDVALFGQHAVQRAQHMVGLILPHLGYQLFGHSLLGQQLRIGRDENAAVLIGEKEVGLCALADDHQLVAQRIQLVAAGQRRLLHHVVRRPLGDLGHAVQRLVALLREIAVEQDPFRKSHHRRAQHQKGRHHRKEGDGNTFAHY